jgi:hypothetical protein
VSAFELDDQPDTYWDTDRANERDEWDEHVRHVEEDERDGRDRDVGESGLKGKAA